MSRHKRDWTLHSSCDVTKVVDFETAYNGSHQKKKGASAPTVTSKGFHFEMAFTLKRLIVSTRHLVVEQGAL